MERRGFLTKLGLLAGAAVITPKILQGTENASESKPEVIIVNDSAAVVEDKTEPLSEDEQLTDGFFKYLEKKTDRVFSDKSFQWIRVNESIYQKPNGQFIRIPIYRTPANYYPLWKQNSELIEKDLAFFNHKLPKTEEEYWEYFIYPEVCEMIHKTRIRHISEGYSDPSYLMSLHFSPILYEPRDFVPLRGILLRGQI